VQGRSATDVVNSILSGIAVPYVDEAELTGQKAGN
jgi:hypothetical protein